MPDGYEVKQEDYVEATERLYLNADKSKVVPEGSPDAAFLFATPGKRVLKKEAEKLGLLKAQKAAPEDKAVKSAPENKSKA